MSDPQNQQQKATLSISAGAAIAAIVAVCGALGVMYTLGVQIGKDSARSECRSATDELDSTKRKLSDTQGELDTISKNFGTWKDAFNNSQKTVNEQTSQIALLTERVKAVNQCDFLRRQFDYYQSELNTHNWTADNPRRDELMTGRREVLSRMDSCAHP
ncbi:hypothetical protein [Burkholderia lata]|uniref:hypothetical protein n=1 Tax=Burkholderia lata (strain ATCC 17760 / DSM 23089 / LMG 22485 / NCIMB 9086 / R18194 / 383) TaxID=482957 RepID=UPI001581DA8B|nr:hypothetical protein [Burkholderia lata]